MINLRQAPEVAVAAIPLSRVMPKEQLKRTALMSQDLPAYEPPLHLHAVSKNARQTEPAKFLVFRVIEKGKPATVPAK